jgi:septum formation protein
MRLILASESPRRRELLARLGLPFEVMAANVNEDIAPGMDAARVAEMLAERKAMAVALRVSDGVILGADTLVAVDDEIIGKPADRADAVRILRKLSRRRQRVITGVCVINKATGRKLVRSEITWVTMRAMTEAEIAAYVDSGEAMGKAGAYAIQETGDRYIEKVEGDFDNVVGLPLHLAQALLREISA